MKFSRIFKMLMNERGGGGGTEINYPSAPPAPSTADAINAWVQSMPQVYQTQLQYAPLEAAQQVALAQQYATPMGQAYKAAQEAMYPSTSALQENLAGQATQGMTSEVPDWMRKEYLSNMNANLGTNVGSPIAADYASTGLLQQKQDWQNYYRNLGLSVAGRQPLAQGGTPSYSNYMGNFTPASNMNYMALNYGNYSNAYANMYGANAQLAGQPAQWMQGVGAVGGLLGGIGMMSSKRLKHNIKLWEKH